MERTATSGVNAMSDVTQRSVYEWLIENGPADLDEIARGIRPYAYCEACDREHDASSTSEEVGSAVRSMYPSGHVSLTSDRKWEAVEGVLPPDAPGELP